MLVSIWFADFQILYSQKSTLCAELSSYNKKRSCSCSNTSQILSRWSIEWWKIDDSALIQDLVCVSVNRRMELKRGCLMIYPVAMKQITDFFCLFLFWVTEKNVWLCDYSPLYCPYWSWRKVWTNTPDTYAVISQYVERWLQKPSELMFTLK